MPFDHRFLALAKLSGSHRRGKALLPHESARLRRRVARWAASGAAHRAHAARRGPRRRHRSATCGRRFAEVDSPHTRRNRDHVAASAVRRHRAFPLASLGRSRTPPPHLRVTHARCPLPQSDAYGDGSSHLGPAHRVRLARGLAPSPRDVKRNLSAADMQPTAWRELYYRRKRHHLLLARNHGS